LARYSATSACCSTSSAAAPVGGLRKPDAGRDLQRQVLDVDGLVERRDQPRAERAGLRLVAVEQEDGELVAAHPRQQVLAADGRAHPLGDALQHDVAGMVAERVVDRLEVVEIHQGHPRPRAGAAATQGVGDRASSSGRLGRRVSASCVA
jgi:hypothetical protein